ncbi:MAG: hypothetical protein HOH58_14720 [Opitutaceae bacterium]|jgi:hypothetical protein|nr:hypothetical protein [Opitutaceae bacterium]
MSDIPVLLSAEGLSTDCAKPEKGRKVPLFKMDVELALERLRSFAALSSTQLADTEAKITIARGDLRLAVTNVGGRLMVAESKAADSNPQEKTPEEIISWLMSVEASDSASKRGKTSSGDGGVLASFGGEGKKIALIVALLIGTLIMGWINFGPKSAPTGMQFVDHPVRVAGLNQEFGGRYGDLTDPSQVVFIVEDDKLRMHLITPTGMEPEPIRVMSYRYGNTGLSEVLVAENGAILERDETGNLVHVGTIYPKIRR